MKRNDDRYWYDKGYSDGRKSERKETKIPKVIGVLSLSVLLWFDQHWVLGFVVWWVLLELHIWHDLRKWHESDPPDMWAES